MTNDIKKITARFDSKCNKCGGQIKRGEVIIYYPLEGKAKHEACGIMDFEEAVLNYADEDLFTNRSM